MQALLGALHSYAAANPGLQPPLQWYDEGFRLKRYHTQAQGAPPEASPPPQPALLRSPAAAVGLGASDVCAVHPTRAAQHHTWHADTGSGQDEEGGTGCRAIAAIFYFNDVARGGETVFMSPRPTQVAPHPASRPRGRDPSLLLPSPRPAAQVVPRRGRLLLFPASFGYYHVSPGLRLEPPDPQTGCPRVRAPCVGADGRAAALESQVRCSPPTAPFCRSPMITATPRAAPAAFSHRYIATTFLMPCKPTKRRFFPPFPVLPVERRHALRARFGAAPPSQLQVTAGQIVAWAAEAAAAAAKAAAVPAAEAEECGT